MKALVELAKIVSSNRLDNVAVFNTENRKDKNSRYNRFLDGLVKDEFTNDDEAAKVLYNSGKENVSYRVLKSRLKERLYNNIVFLESGKRLSGSHFSASQTVYRYMFVANTLIRVGARNAGLELLEKVMQKATDLQLNDILQQCSLHFRRESMLLGDKKRFDLYNKKYIETAGHLFAENRAEELYYKVMIHFNRSSSQPKQIIETAKECLDELESIASNHDIYIIKNYEHNIKTIYYQLISDFKSALDSCNSFEEYLLRNRNFYSKARHGNILVTKLSCYLHLGQFKSGMEAANKAVNLYTEGNVNWFIVLEIYFLLALNNNDMQKATDIYCQAVEHSRFNYLRPQQIEVWKIYGGYLWFLLNFYKDEKSLRKLTEQKHAFRMSKLLNEIPLFAKDKQGMNVAVLILQALLLLEKKDYVSIISRTEALKSYIYRNLAKDEAYRSYYFIKMLLAMEKNQFERKKTEEKTRSTFEKLRQGELNYTATQARMEIIPYERLWGIALDLIS